MVASMFKKEEAVSWTCMFSLENREKKVPVEGGIIFRKLKSECRLLRMD